LVEGLTEVSANRALTSIAITEPLVASEVARVVVEHRNTANSLVIDTLLRELESSGIVTSFVTFSVESVASTRQNGVFYISASTLIGAGTLNAVSTNTAITVRIALSASVNKFVSFTHVDAGRGTSSNTFVGAGDNNAVDINTTVQILGNGVQCKRQEYEASEYRSHS